MVWLKVASSTRWQAAAKLARDDYPHGRAVVKAKFSLVEEAVAIGIRC
jgi:hypothetical protein